MKNLFITLIAFLSFSIASAQFKLGGALGYELDGQTMGLSI